MAVVHLVLQSSCQPLDDKYSVSILKNTFGVIHYRRRVIKLMADLPFATTDNIASFANTIQD